MAATHYTQWIYNKLVGTDFAKGKRFEIRFTFGTDEYDYGVSHPAGCIYLDQLKVVDFGKTKWQRYDESCSLVAANRTIEFRDQYFFSGTVNGSPTGTIDLTTDKTSLLPFLFQSTGETCFMHLSQLNADGSLKEIYFSGVLDTELIDGNVIQMVLPMGSNERKLQTKKYLFITAGGELQKHTVEELVSGSRTNGVNDGRVAGFLQSDMYSFLGKPRGLAPWWMGLIVKSGVDWNTVWKTDSTIGTSGVFYIASNKVYEPCFYPSSANSTFIGFKNPYMVEDGFQALTYSTLVTKIADICRFTYDSSDVDNDFKQYVQRFDGLRYNTDSYGITQATTNIFDHLVLNYNVRLGVKPTYFMISDGSSDTVDTDNSLFNLPRYTITAATNATPIVCTLAKPINMPVGATFQACRITGALGNTNANNAVTFTVIDSTHVSLQDASGVDISGNGTYTANSGIMQLGDEDWFSLTTPATWSRSDTLADVMKRICYRYGLLMDFDIWQSGADKGRPRIILRNLLKSSGSVPSAWTDPNNPTLLKGITISERQQTIKNVRLKYAGDDSEIYCPTDKGESFDIEIHGRTKQWGGNSVYQASYFINNGNGNVNQQQDTTFFFNADSFRMGNSWVIGACDFIPLSSPLGYNSNFIATDYDETGFGGYYPITYEEYFGNNTKNWDARLPSADTIWDGVANTNESHFNTVVNKAKFFANVFLNSLTVEKRSFRTCVDDSGFIRTLRPNLTGSWLDEDGTVTSKLLHTIEIEELKGIADCEFTPALPDYTELADYTVIVKNGTGAGTGGVVGGAGGGPSGGGGTTDLSLAIIKAPDSAARNTITGDTSGNTALTIVGSEDLPPLAVTIVNGQNDDVSILDGSGISRSSIVLTGATAVFSVTGWTNGTNGKLLYVRNGTAYDCTFKDNIGSGSNDQIRTPNHADYTIPQDGGCMFRYETSDNKWHLLGDNQSGADLHDIVDNPSATQTIQPTVNGVVGLVLKKKSGNTADIVEVQNDSGTNVFYVDTNGLPTFPNNAIWQGPNTKIGLDTGTSISYGTSGQPLISQGGSATPKWGTVSDLVSFLAGNYVLLDPSGNQTIQSTTATVQLILKMRTGDPAASPIFNIKNDAGTSVFFVTNEGTLDTFGEIRLESKTLSANPLTVDIASFLTGLNILDLDTQGRLVVYLTDTSGHTNSIYNLCGMVATSDGSHLSIFLDDTFSTNGNQIIAIHESATEATASNRIHDPFSLNVAFAQLDFVYLNRGGTPRWMPKRT